MKEAQREIFEMPSYHAHGFLRSRYAFLYCMFFIFLFCLLFNRRMAEEKEAKERERKKEPKMIARSVSGTGSCS